MRRITMLALVTVLAVTGAACGGDDDDQDGATTTDDTEADDGGDDNATDAAVAAGLLDDDCQFLLAGAFLNPLAALAPGSEGDIAEANEQLQAIADDAPDEIRDAMQTLSEGFAAMAEALEGVDMSDPQAFADPDVQERFAELEDVFDEEYEAAGQTVSEYIEAECAP